MKKLKTKKYKILAVTLARSGSKSIIKKNITKLNKKPLIHYTIKEALKSRLITHYVVSTNDKEIKRVAERCGAKVPFLRPNKLSTDTAKAVDADKHALKWCEKKFNIKYDFFVELMATNPFKTYKDIDNVLTKLIKTKADSVIGVVKLDDMHPIRIKKIEGDKIKDFTRELKEIPERHRQQLKPDAYVRNGSIYAAKRDLIMKGKRYGTTNSRPYIMNSDYSVNIDSKQDLIKAKILLNQKNKF